MAERAIIYGATGAGWGAAIYAARAGLPTVVIEPTDYLWGMWPNGLGQTDREVGNVSYRWGALVELTKLFGSYIGANGEFLFPSMAACKQGFDQLIANEPLITVVKNAPLEAVYKDGARLLGIRCGGVDYMGTQFADGSYEGDLLAMAGCMMSFGRDDAQVSGEGSAGRRNVTNRGPLAYDPATGNRLKNITPRPAGAFGEADLGTMAYMHRTIVWIDDPAGRQWTDLRLLDGSPVPVNFDDYLVELNIATKYGMKVFPASVGRDLAPVVDGHVEHDANNGGGLAIGLNDIGPQHDWCYLTWPQRNARIRDWMIRKAGLMITIVSDPRWAAAVPELVADTKRYSLPTNLYPNSPIPGWSPAMYVRIGRRLVGQEWMTQNDAFLPLRNDVDEPMTVGGYLPDSHWVWRFADTDGAVGFEGFGIRPDEPNDTSVYQMPWGCMKPFASQASNLIALWCWSGSTNGWILGRVELTGIKVGQAGGIAMGAAAAEGITTSELEYARHLVPALSAAGAITRIVGGV